MLCMRVPAESCQCSVPCMHTLLPIDSCMHFCRVKLLRWENQRSDFDDMHCILMLRDQHSPKVSPALSYRSRTVLAPFTVSGIHRSGGNEP